MMWAEPPSGSESHLTDDLFTNSLPSAECTVCKGRISRREPRVQIRASWRKANDTLCPACWGTIISWASRFAFRQLELPLS
jgi:hypothetical protein